MQGGDGSRWRGPRCSATGSGDNGSTQRRQGGRGHLEPSEHIVLAGLPRQGHVRAHLHRHHHSLGCTPMVVFCHGCLTRPPLSMWDAVLSAKWAARRAVTERGGGGGSPEGMLCTSPRSSDPAALHLSGSPPDIATGVNRSLARAAGDDPGPMHKLVLPDVDAMLGGG